MLDLGLTADQQLLVETVRELDNAGIVVDDLALRRPTLDDVFLSLTGKAAEAAESEGEQ